MHNSNDTIQLENRPVTQMFQMIDASNLTFGNVGSWNAVLESALEH